MPRLSSTSIGYRSLRQLALQQRSVSQSTRKQTRAHSVDTLYSSPSARPRQYLGVSNLSDRPRITHNRSLRSFSSTMPAKRYDGDPTLEQTIELFRSLESHFPSSTLGEDRWYLVALSSLLGAGHPDFAADLYQYLIAQPKYATSESRKALMRRIRECLVESVVIMGVCKPLEAVFALIEVTAEEDRDYSFSREHWKSGPENLARSKEWFSKIYFEKNKQDTTDKLDQHKDFKFITDELTYGFFLGDLSILDAIDTEIVVLSGIAIQNLPLETAWHLRGTRRVGVSHDDTELVQQCIEMVAKFAGSKVHKLPRVKDIEHEIEADKADQANQAD